MGTHLADVVPQKPPGIRVRAGWRCWAAKATFRSVPDSDSDSPGSGVQALGLPGARASHFLDEGVVFLASVSSPTPFDFIGADFYPYHYAAELLLLVVLAPRSVPTPLLLLLLPQRTPHAHTRRQWTVGCPHFRSRGCNICYPSAPDTHTPDVHICLGFSRPFLLGALWVPRLSSQLSSVRCAGHDRGAPCRWPGFRMNETDGFRQGADSVRVNAVEFVTPISKLKLDQRR